MTDGDFPVPDFGFDDDPCDLSAVVVARSPSKVQTLTNEEAAELLELHGLVVSSEVPLRCTSNSAVYVASSLSDDRRWALKVTGNRRCMEEEYAKRLELPNSSYLVETVRMVHLSTKSAMQMELCPSGEISSLELEEPLIWRMINHIAFALREIHRGGWLHLDVSPGNILFDDPYFKLADFGTLTKVGQFFVGCEGAGPFVSPEALAFPNGPYEVTQQTDIFSFGVVLLECISGQAAPRGGNEAYPKLRHGEIQLGQGLYTCKCSEELRILVNAMLSVNPGARPSAEDLIGQSQAHACCP
jgi:membrane-associated tyrosine/threonine-specific cdc2-inhibitory kinase